jgi:hypothetical protein
MDEVEPGLVAVGQIGIGIAEQAFPRGRVVDLVPEEVEVEEAQRAALGELGKEMSGGLGRDGGGDGRFGGSSPDFSKRTVAAKAAVSFGWSRSVMACSWAAASRTSHWDCTQPDSREVMSNSKRLGKKSPTSSAAFACQRAQAEALASATRPSGPSTSTAAWLGPLRVTAWAEAGFTGWELKPAPCNPRAKSAVGRIRSPDF